MTQATLYDTHMHTPLCHHATGEPEEYAAVAAQRNLKGIVITCHNPLPDGLAPSVRMDPRQWPDYIAMVKRAREAWAGQVDVRLGLECDWLPGLEDHLRQQVFQPGLDYVLGSLHPQMAEYRKHFWHGDPVSYQKSYFSNLGQMARLGLFDCLAHPDLVKNCPPGPEAWNLDAILDHVRRCLDEIAATGVAMELNTSGLLKAIPEFNPGMTILREMARRNIPCVIGSDSHVPQRVGDEFDVALDCLEEAGYRKVSYFLQRQRQEVDIAVARDSLASQVR